MSGQTEVSSRVEAPAVCCPGQMTQTLYPTTSSPTTLPSQDATPGFLPANVDAPGLRQSLNHVVSSLRAGGVVEWRIEAEVLLRHVLGVDRSEFLALVYGSDLSLTYSQSTRLESLIHRRLSGEPLAYIVGRREFYGLDLRITKGVLIPRQETELLVDVALEHLARSCSRSPLIVDVGTGSGAIGLAVAAHAETARVIATDVSEEALAVARRNAVNLGLSDRIEFVYGDMLSPIRQPIDVLVSNPPYIPSADIAELAVEVRREPRIALDGGTDGLDPLRHLFEQATGKLAADGVVIVELMPEQMERAGALAVETLGHDIDVDTRRDLMGNDRALVVRRHRDSEVRASDGGTRNEC